MGTSTKHFCNPLHVFDRYLLYVEKKKEKVHIIREGVKKRTIESVIMIIPGRGGGGGPRVLITPSYLGFFNAPNLIVWLY